MSAWQKTKTFFKALTAIFTFFASIAGLTAFISLYLSVQQFEEQRTYDVSKEMQQNAALISSLRTEISMNITSCDQLITQKDDYLSSTTTPIGEFNCVIIEEVIKRGLITNDAERLNLYYCYNHMIRIKATASQWYAVFLQQSFFPNVNYGGEPFVAKHKQAMKDTLDAVEKLKQCLSSAQSYFQGLEDIKTKTQSGSRRLTQ